MGALRVIPIYWSSLAATIMIVLSSTRKIRDVISVMVAEVAIAAANEIKTDIPVNIIRTAVGSVSISIIDRTGGCIVVPAGTGIGSRNVVPTSIGSSVNNAAATS